MMADAEAVVRKVITAAKGGDMTAAKLIVDRIAPLRRPRVRFALPAVTDAASLLQAHGALLAAVAKGQLAPDEASQVAAMLAAHRQAIEATVTEQRLTALEQATGLRHR